MANLVIQDTPLKFTKNDFKLQDTPDLIINVWTYNFYIPHCQTCNACKVYCKWSLKFGKSDGRKNGVILIMQLKSKKKMIKIL